MFGDLNKVQIIGNLGKDPDLRVTPQGTPVATFSVACNRNVKSGDGQWEKQTEWFRVVVWRDQAESASKFLTKGKRVYIEGRLQTRKYQDPQGQEKTTVEVIADSIILLDKDRKDGPPPIDDNADPQPWKSNKQPARSNAAPNPFEEEEHDLEDIPF